MIKSELIDHIAKKANITNTKAQNLIDTIFDCMAKELSDGGRIEIRRFGSFSAKKYGSFQGRNPATGESITVPPKRSPVFKTSPNLLALINQGT